MSFVFQISSTVLTQAVKNQVIDRLQSHAANNENNVPMNLLHMH